MGSDRLQRRNKWLVSQARPLRGENVIIKNTACLPLIVRMWHLSDSILYLKHNFEILNKALGIFTINTNDITTLTSIASITAIHPRPQGLASRAIAKGPGIDHSGSTDFENSNQQLLAVLNEAFHSLKYKL